ncbi:unnamed protein product [Meganyctiphanes norvegica]|uniref:Uncharacterized protein n=1 Tax=Meganyctiphanes norvegica TaxID=48144 RepID=A0AAV2QGH6_MEGNR
MLYTMSVAQLSQMFLVLVLALDLTLINARDRANSKMLQWDDPEPGSPADLPPPPLPFPLQAPESRSLADLISPEVLAAREERKLIFINNKAYDLSDSEQAKVWDLYMNKAKEEGQLVRHHVLKPRPQMDSLETALNGGDLMVDIKPEEEMNLQKQEDAVVGSVAHVDIDVEGREVPNYNNWMDLSEVHDPSTRLGLASDYEESLEPLKMSRFVADPEKAHLIQYLDADEVKKLYEKKKTTTTTTTTEVPVVDRVDVADENDKEESTDVHFAYTQHSVLQLLLNELLNIGDLLGRELMDNLGGVLSYLWENLVNYVTGRKRRSISGNSTELHIYISELDPNLTCCSN